MNWKRSRATPSLVFCLLSGAAMAALPCANVALATDAADQDEARRPSCKEALSALPSNGVLFYSPWGQQLAGCLKIPPPPLVRMPLSQVDPDRHVPARRWRSPMCDRWNDANEVCERSEPSGRSSKVSCRPLRKDDFPWHDVICTSSTTNASKYCAEQSVYVVDLVDGKKQRFFQDYYTSILNFYLKDRKWKLAFADFNDHFLVKFDYDYTCTLSYSWPREAWHHTYFSIQRSKP